jgi:hypothetical protein
MKKKTVKKLMLAKETVRNLENGELGRAAGATTTACQTDTNCCSGLDGCGTTACGPTQTGGSRYC